jgi:IclR family transcriptional regulator, KDG regulon repressor
MAKPRRSISIRDVAPSAAGPSAGKSGEALGQMSERYVVRAIDRALTVLVLLASTPTGMDASALARGAQLHVSTVFRILQTLKLRNFVVEAPGGLYRVGPKAFEVGSSFLRSTSLQSEGQTIVERLSAETGETASLGILDSDEVFYLAIAHGQRELGIQSNVGTRHPVYCTALGKVLMADLDWPEAKALLSRIERPRMTINTIVNIGRLREELLKVGSQGYALDAEERTIGVRAVGAPVRDHSGRVVAAISAAGPAFRIAGASHELLIGQVQKFAAEFSQRLGYAAGRAG